jgi:hypothetical protein
MRSRVARVREVSATNKEQPETRVNAGAGAAASLADSPEPAPALGIAGEKYLPRTDGLLIVGGGVVARTKRLLKVRDTGVLASCEALRTGAKSGG